MTNIDMKQRGDCDVDSIIINKKHNKNKSRKDRKNCC